MKFKIITAMFIATVLTVSCSTVSESLGFKNYSGTFEGDKYVFPSKRFSVVPPINHYNLKIYDHAEVPNVTPEYADFIYDGYWPVVLGYSTEIYKISAEEAHKIEQNWEKSNPLLLTIKQRIQEIAVMIGDPICRIRVVKKHKAYECAVHAITDYPLSGAKDKKKWEQIYFINDPDMLDSIHAIKSEIISTAILFEDNQLVLSLYVRRSEFKNTQEEIIPSDKYESFLASFEVYKEKK